MIDHRFLHYAGFSLNHTNDAKDATEISIVEDDWGQLKADVSCDDNVVMGDLQTSK
jgi:hypothetical protein